MPNWVKNIVEFDNDRALLDCITEEDGDKTFDFNKVIPMPKEIQDTTSPNPDKEQAALLKKKYGAEDWYNWACDNWGTKWNAHDTEIIDSHTVKFNTAWSMPDQIFKKLSKKYNTRIVVRFADEGISENSGTSVYENGVEVLYNMGDYKFCKQVWSE